MEVRYYPYRGISRDIYRSHGTAWSSKTSANTIQHVFQHVPRRDDHIWWWTGSDSSPPTVSPMNSTNTDPV